MCLEYLSHLLSSFFFVKLSMAMTRFQMRSEFAGTLFSLAMLSSSECLDSSPLLFI